jgi:hypothetical protein
MKLYYPTKKEAENHYADLSKKCVLASPLVFLLPFPPSALLLCLGGGSDSPSLFPHGCVSR